MRSPSRVSPRLSAFGVCLIVIAGGALVARAAFTTPELVVGQPVEAGPNAGVATAAVWDGEAFVAAWSDDRSGQSGVYGARVAADGTLLNHPNLIFITDQTNLDYAADAPALAFDGTNLLLAWRQQDGIWVRRIDRTGKAVDQKATRVSLLGAGGGVGRPCVVFDGTNYLVVMRERYSDTMWNEIDATRVSTAGVPLDASSVQVRFTLVKDAPLVGDPVAHAGATGTLIAWGEAPVGGGGTGNILGAFVPKGAAATQTTPPISIAVDAGAARGPVGVELDGAGFFVAWTEFPTGASTQSVRGRDVSAAGDLGAPLSLLSGVTVNGGVLGTDGQAWLLGWYEPGADHLPRPTLARIDHAGAVVDRWTLDDQGLTNSSGVTPFALATGGGHTLAAWNVQVGFRAVPHAAAVPAPGSARPTPTRLAYALSRQTSPAAASNGQGYLVAWREQRDTAEASVFGARVDVKDGVLDGTGFRIGGSSVSLAGPAVISSGDGYLVSWLAGASVLARVVGADGTLRGTQDLAVFSSAGSAPRVAIAGGVYLIAAGCDTSNLCVARVSAAGALLDPAPQKIATSQYVSVQRVSGSSSQFLVLWYDSTAKGERAARVDAATGAILDPTGVLLPAIGTEALGFSFDVASSGDQYLFAWKRFSGGVVAARLSPDLTWLDTAPIAAPHLQENSHIDLEDTPSVVWGGTDYVIAWRDQVQTIYAGDPTNELLGFSHMSTQGVLTGGGDVYSGTAGYLTPSYSSDGPPLAAGAGTVLIGDTVVDRSHGYKVSRNRAWLSSDTGTCPDALCKQVVMGLPDASVGTDASGASDGGTATDAGAHADAPLGADAGAPTDAATSDAPGGGALTPPDAARDATATDPDGASTQPVSDGSDGSDARTPMHAGGGCSCSVNDSFAATPPSAGLLLLAIVAGWRRGRRRPKR